MQKKSVYRLPWVFAILTLAILVSDTGVSGIPEDQPISVDFQNADIRTVLRSFAVYTDKNIIASRDVEGPGTVHLENVPW